MNIDRPNYTANAQLCAAFFLAAQGPHNHERRCRMAVAIHNGATTEAEIDPPAPEPVAEPRPNGKKARKAAEPAPRRKVSRVKAPAGE